MAPPTTHYLLPPEAYWSDAWFEHEQRQLFGHTWHLAADFTELAEPGDYVTLVAGTDPLLVVRGIDGELRCFHNLCRHRGMLLLTDAGRTRAGIRCPYHLWNFGLDGDLRNVPQEGQFCGLDRSQWGLLPGSVGEWGGLVFVHPDADAPPVAEWLGELPGHVGSFQPELLQEVGRLTLDARCNWKLFVENHVDVLHLWYLHARTLNDFEHSRFEWHQLHRNWASYEPVKDGIGEPKLSAATTTIAHLDERDRRGLGAHAAFPNVLMATSAEFFATYVARPTGPASMQVDLRVRAEPGADPARLLGSLQSFISEDITGCEGVQATIRSSHFIVGPLAEQHEQPIMLFQQHLLDALGDIPDRAGSGASTVGAPVKARA